MIRIAAGHYLELQKFPCFFIKEDCAKLDNVFICKPHLSEYKPGNVNGKFKLHCAATCPIVASIIAGETEPQEGYLIRRFGEQLSTHKGTHKEKKTILRGLFLSELEEARSKSLSAPPLSGNRTRAGGNRKRQLDDNENDDDDEDSEAEVIRLREALVVVKEQLKSTNKSWSAKVANARGEGSKERESLLEEILMYKQKIADTEAERDANKAFVWSHESVVMSTSNFSDKELYTLLGLDRASWLAYVDFFELHDFHEYWGGNMRCLDWKSALLISQIKLRHNTAYLILQKLFFVDQRRAGEIFRQCTEFGGSLYALVMQFDTRPLVQENRFNGLRTDRAGLAMTKVQQITDAVSIPLQRFHSEELRSSAHSDYKGGARLKVQGNIDASAEPSWISKAYLAGAGASDQEILENGASAGSYQFEPTKAFDLMEADDILMGDRGTLVRVPLLKHNQKTGKKLKMMLPPFVHNGKLTQEEKERGGEIAKVR
jgi:hypothetical protein